MSTATAAPLTAPAAPLTAPAVGLGARAPFRSRAEAGPIACAATIEGTIPEWLRGDLVRTAPAVFERPAAAGHPFRAHHWFDGLGLLFGFRIGAGGVEFRQRLMATDVEAETRRGRNPTASFGTPIDRGFWRRLIQPIPPTTDNTNVHVLPLGDELVAMTETRHQWAVDRDTLAVTRPVAYADDLGDISMIAHPHLDFDRDLVVNLSPQLGASGGVVVYEHAPASRTRRKLATIPCKRVPYIHAFGLTPRHVVVIGHPFDVSALSLLWSNRGVVDHFRWRPEVGTTLWLVDRHTGEHRTHHAPAGFVFHVVNAFEDGPNTILDVCLFPDAAIVAHLGRDALVRAGLPTLAPSIVRWTMTPGRDDATSETLLAHGFDFPTIRYRQRSGQRHGVAWGARLDGGTRTTIVRHDAGGHVTSHSDPDYTFGEPIFVAKPGSDVEDAGVLLTVGAHRSDDRSELRVLDARTLEPIARASVPLPIPLGFHGSFLRDA